MVLTGSRLDGGRPIAGAAARPRALADPVAEASCQLARALGMAAPAARAAGRRAARLWRRHLLAGAHQDPLAVIGPGHPSALTTPVHVGNIGIHMVCPHHLTVALGHAELAYLPAGRIVGLGRLASLVQACCARLVLQEEASQHIAQALWQALGARATWVQLTAAHPCVGVPAPGSHGAAATCQATAGEPAAQADLQRWLRPVRHA